MMIAPEQPQHAAGIESLLDDAFGAKRHAKTVYRLRAGIGPVPGLSFVATDEDGRLVGTIRYWPVLIGTSTPAILLGPIAIHADWRSKGLGGTLIRYSLDRAAEQGHRIVLLVGDAPYYVRFGFTRENTLGLSLPGPVDLDRFLGLELVPGALDGVVGLVGRADGSSAPAEETDDSAAEEATGTLADDGAGPSPVAPLPVAPLPVPPLPATLLPTVLPPSDHGPSASPHRPRRSARR
ncbi:GNAT family N-acetyltransferase [Rhodospirillum centenum]|uniref:Acetyltransferase, GNAT family n=1 Tax=Rhodospirillum centenum (strain ATCC 51521 / SW) TaxID=414684 RepID=B6IPR0_RHOCS|nr:N-acetyltransferase [Rhodospirillum centenum]ACI99762.1 acetyltransferase, GNAT family [Rhodospirillum centenum SW]